MCTVLFVAFIVYAQTLLNYKTFLKIIVLSVLSYNRNMFSQTACITNKWIQITQQVRRQYNVISATPHYAVVSRPKRPQRPCPPSCNMENWKIFWQLNYQTRWILTKKNYVMKIWHKISLPNQSTTYII